MQSIRDSKIRVNYEVIVVDNGSSDGSIGMIQHEFPETILIKNRTNEMFAKGNNQAIKASKGEFLLFLNSDTVIFPGSIEKLYNFIAINTPEIGCVGPTILNTDGTIQSEGRPFPRPISGAIFRQLKIHAWGRYAPFLDKVLPAGTIINGKVRKVGFIAGCCMLVSRHAIKQIGGFDETLLFYREEIDLCRRLREMSFETWVVPFSQIIHIGGASLKKKYNDFIIFENNRKWAEKVLAKNIFSLFQDLLGCCINLAGSMIWFLAYTIFFNKQRRLKELFFIKNEWQKIRLLVNKQ